MQGFQLDITLHLVTSSHVEVIGCGWNKNYLVATLPDMCLTFPATYCLSAPLRFKLSHESSQQEAAFCKKCEVKGAVEWKRLLFTLIMCVGGFALTVISACSSGSLT